MQDIRSNSQEDVAIGEALPPRFINGLNPSLSTGSSECCWWSIGKIQGFLNECNVVDGPLCLRAFTKLVSWHFTGRALPSLLTSVECLFWVVLRDDSR